jgi:hypothetical protein
MAKNKRRKQRGSTPPEAWQTRMVEMAVEGYDDDTVKPVVLEPREWLDHAIVDVVMDTLDCGLHVVYDRGLLIRWTAIKMLYEKGTYKYVEEAELHVSHESHVGVMEEAAEYVDYNSIRAMAYMGKNRPFVTAQA